MFSTSGLLNSRALGLVRNDIECIGRIAGDSSLTLCLRVETRPSWPSDKKWNGVSMSIGSSWYCEYLSGMTIDLHQSVCFTFPGIVPDDFCTVLIVSATVRSDFSSWADFWAAFVLTISDMSSFRCPRILEWLKRCWLVDVIVTKGQREHLKIFLKIPFAGRYHLLTILGLWWRCKSSLVLAVAIISVAGRGSADYLLDTQTVFECFIVNL